jgi:hypothetical protein
MVYVQEAKLRREMLEAAFDGEVSELERMMGEAESVMEESVDVADVHGNTLLSEAAAGGAAAAVALLLRRGAHPNSRGEFGRTPLWRAAFMGKMECVRPLLEGGADPRIGAPHLPPSHLLIPFPSSRPAGNCGCFNMSGGIRMQNQSRT